MKRQFLPLLLLVAMIGITPHPAASQTFSDSVKQGLNSFNRTNRYDSENQRDWQQNNDSRAQSQTKRDRDNSSKRQQPAQNTQNNRSNNYPARKERPSSSGHDTTRYNNYQHKNEKQHSENHDRRNVFTGKKYSDKHGYDNDRNYQDKRSSGRNFDDSNSGRRNEGRKGDDRRKDYDNDKGHHKAPSYQKEIRVIRHRDHQPDYRLYKRHEYIYYRTPWYNTRFLAPIPFHFHKTGYRVRELPRSYVRIIVGGIPFFYYSGVFYRPLSSTYVVVSAPIGAVVGYLPVGFIAFSIGLSTYYYANDTYYLWDEPLNAYRVVEKPSGAEKAMEVATTGRLFVYPNKGQDEKLQAKDRYECHRWAVTESGVDPTVEDEALTDREHNSYTRAIGACLEGRDYTVK